MRAQEDPRELALQVLVTCQQQGGWLDGVLKRSLTAARLDPRDAALAARLCYGVMQNRMYLDFCLSSFASMPLRRMEVRVLNILRLGACQMLYMDRIPVSAAVDTSVRLAKVHAKNPRAAGMVNAVLRNLGRSLDCLPQIPEGDRAEQLSLKYSHPRPLVEAFLEQYGEQETEQLLQADNSIPETAAQVNTLRCTPEEAEQELRAEGVSVSRHPWLPGCLLLSGTGDLEQRRAFREGHVWIQDPAARLAVLAADPAPGTRVLDACAAPGGKSFAAAVQMENRGEILSCDIYPRKVKVIAAGAARLGLSIIKPAVQDAAVLCPEREGQFDTVIADVPCSGLGVIRKKPDIRYRDLKETEGLPALQRSLLDTVSRYVRPGGVLLFSTCTLLQRENGDVVRSFLEEHREFVPERFVLPGPAGTAEEGMLTLLPHRHGTDGFFICRLRKRRPEP